MHTFPLAAFESHARKKALASKIILALTAVAFLQGCVAVHSKPATKLPRVDVYTEAKLNEIFRRLQAVRAACVPEGAASIVSTALLGTAYKADALSGSATTPERLIIDLRGLDCFTFLDNIEALRRADNYPDYVRQLTNVRYAEGTVDFNHRHHFFTDWAQGSGALTRDITKELGPATHLADKCLNAKADGTAFIQGLPPVSRTITYLPSAAMTVDILNQLQEGDYIGAYSQTPGLDVSHVGVFLRTEQGPVFRNASSRQLNMKVVDYPFLEYVQQVPGIVVLRPL